MQRKELLVMMEEMAYHQLELSKELQRIGLKLTETGKFVSEGMERIGLRLDTINELSDRYRKLVVEVIQKTP